MKQWLVCERRRSLTGALGTTADPTLIAIVLLRHIWIEKAVYIEQIGEVVVLPIVAIIFLHLRKHIDSYAIFSSLEHPTGSVE